MKKLLSLGLVFCILLSGCGADAASKEAEIEKIETLGNTVSMTTGTIEEYKAEQGITDNESPAPSDEVMVITEKLFAAQINYIYNNPKVYIGKTIQYEGMYTNYEDAKGNPMGVVYRNGPGCCTDDDVVGFEVVYDGDVEPQENDWVEITGTVEYVLHGGIEFLAVKLSEMTIKEERGLETVE